MAAGRAPAPSSAPTATTPTKPVPPSGSPDLAGHVEACLGCHPSSRTPPPRRSTRVTGPASAASTATCPGSSPGSTRWCGATGSPRPATRACSGATPRTRATCATSTGPSPGPRAQLEKGWVRAPAQAERPAEPAPGTPAGEVWLHSTNSFLRAAAAEAYARSPQLENRLALLLESLGDEAAFNRTLGLIAVERVLGRRISRDEYDLLAPPATRARQAADLAGAQHAGR